MPVLDSFKVDHTKMKAPFVRKAKDMETKSGDEITVWDLRFCTPNEEIMDERGIHTLEHLFAGFMRDHLNDSEVEIIDVSPMGCRTGFYMSVIGSPAAEKIVKAWGGSMRDVLGVENESQIPELNKYQCGTYTMHSLTEAKKIAKNVLDGNLGVLNNEDVLLSGF